MNNQSLNSEGGLTVHGQVREIIRRSLARGANFLSTEDRQTLAAGCGDADGREANEARRRILRDAVLNLSDGMSSIQDRGDLVDGMRLLEKVSRQTASWDELVDLTMVFLEFR